LPHVVEAMIKYLYTGGYKRPEKLGEEYGQSAIQFEASMYAVADRYDIKGLSDLALGKYKELLIWNYQPLDLLDFLEEGFIGKIGTDESLQALVITHISLKRKKFHQNEKARQRLMKLIDEIPTFRRALFDSYLQDTASDWCFSCISRGSKFVKSARTGFDIGIQTDTKSDPDQTTDSNSESESESEFDTVDDVQCEGTGKIPFQPFVQQDVFDRAMNHFYAISTQEPYREFSHEELRLADYAAGRRFGNVSEFTFRLGEEQHQSHG
jgi:hypothetical protein